MPIRIRQVDAFTKRRFAGNPAAVCVLAEPADGANARRRGRNESFRDGIREAAGRRVPIQFAWFTPVAEVDLCGHATLATAHILWEDGHLPKGEPALFESAADCRPHGLVPTESSSIFRPSPFPIRCPMPTSLPGWSGRSGHP